MTLSKTIIQICEETEKINNRWEYFYKERFSKSTYLAMYHADPDTKIHKLWAKLDKEVLPTNKVKKIRRMRIKGYSGTVISKIMGCTRQYVYKVCRIGDKQH